MKSVFFLRHSSALTAHQKVLAGILLVDVPNSSFCKVNQELDRLQLPYPQWTNLGEVFSV